MKRRAGGPALGALAVSAAAVAFVAAVGACSTGDPALRRALKGPDRAQFERVSPALGARCGSLDCHGSPYRNLRLFGPNGLRLDPAHLPETKIKQDSEAGQREVQANYEAVVGLEPEVMTVVLAEGGRGAERLSLVRKAYGQDDHKGVRAIAPGDAADRCVLSWIRGAVDTAACDAVVAEDDRPRRAPVDAGPRDADGTPDAPAGDAAPE